VSKFEFSPFIDVKVIDPVAAAQFYIEYFGWLRIEGDHEQTLKFGPLTVFLTKAKNKMDTSNVHFEMTTSEDIESLKLNLEKLGCTYCKSGMKNAYMFTDPFGNNFHIYQK
jgi:hypothetical protein